MERATDAASFIEKPLQFVNQLKANTTSTGVKDTMVEVKKMIDLKKSADFTKCIEISREYYESFFNHQILNLMHMFPLDHTDKDGQLFWSGPKRAPTAFPFNPEDDLHVHFV